MGMYVSAMISVTIRELKQPCKFKATLDGNKSSCGCCFLLSPTTLLSLYCNRYFVGTRLYKIMVDRCR